MCGQEKRLTHIQTTSRPDGVWPEVWSNMSRNSQREARKQRGSEKPKLDVARRLRRIYCIASDDQDFDTVIKKAKRKLETHMESAMPCRAQENSAKKTSNNPMSTSRRRLCAETQLVETSRTKQEENQIQFMLTKLMLTNLKDVA